MQQRAVAGFAGIPPRIPGAVDAETKPDWIDLLTHNALLAALRLRLDFAHHDGAVRDRLENRATAAACAYLMPLDYYRLADMGRGDDEIVDIEVMVVLGISDRRFQTFAHIARNALAREFEIGERSRNLLTAD